MKPPTYDRSASIIVNALTATNGNTNATKPIINICMTSLPVASATIQLNTATRKNSPDSIQTSTDEKLVMNSPNQISTVRASQQGRSKIFTKNFAIIMFLTSHINDLCPNDLLHAIAQVIHPSYPLHGILPLKCLRDALRTAHLPH